MLFNKYGQPSAKATFPREQTRDPVAEGTDVSPRVAPRLPVSTSSPPKPHVQRQTTSGVDPPVPRGGSSWPEAPRQPGLAPPCHLSFAASPGASGDPGGLGKDCYLFKGVGVEEVCSCFLVGFSFWFFFLFSYFPLKKMGAKRDAGGPELGLPLVPAGSERGPGRVWAGSRCSLLRGQGSVCVTRSSFKAAPPPPGALRGVVCCPRGKAAAFRGSAFFPLSALTFVPGRPCFSVTFCSWKGKPLSAAESVFSCSLLSAPGSSLSAV